MTPITTARVETSSSSSTSVVSTSTRGGTTSRATSAPLRPVTTKNKILPPITQSLHPLLNGPSVPSRYEPPIGDGARVIMTHREKSDAKFSSTSISRVASTASAQLPSIPVSTSLSTHSRDSHLVSSFQKLIITDPAKAHIIWDGDELSQFGQQILSLQLKEKLGAPSSKVTEQIQKEYQELHSKVKIVYAATPLSGKNPIQIEFITYFYDRISGNHSVSIYGEQVGITVFIRGELQLTTAELEKIIQAKKPRTPFIKKTLSSHEEVEKERELCAIAITGMRSDRLDELVTFSSTEAIPKEDPEKRTAELITKDWYTADEAVLLAEEFTEKYPHWHIYALSEGNNTAKLRCTIKPI